VRLTPQMRYIKHFLFFSPMLFVLTANAQLAPVTTHTIQNNLVPDTVFHKKHRRYRDTEIMGGLAALTVVSYLFIDPGMQEETQENLTSWERFSAIVVTPLGSGNNNFYALGATAITAFALKNKRLKKTVIVWAGALCINDLFTNQLKITLQRHRPSSGDPYNTFDWRNGPQLNKSFPSAHTSNIFSTATTFAIEYRDKKWVPPVAFSIAGLVGISRIYRNAHWTSDVVGGALVGFGSAKLSDYLYRKVNAAILKKQKNLSTGF
jgi:membrane-associated phospholipid phosphatase